jgi:monovalent cation:H+ antiporter-2, CPA2 family
LRGATSAIYHWRIGSLHEPHEFLSAVATVLCTAAVMTILCQKLRQPIVLGYIVAGMIIGPHVPVPLVADQRIVHTLSELGVILLMYALGLEFSLRRLLKVGATAAVTAVIQCSIMLWLGFVVGRAFGWTPRESIFAGAIIAISSTTIIAKAFDEQKIRGRLRELVVGILIVEDLIAILLLAALTTISSPGGLELARLGATAGRLGAFLAGLLVIGLLVVPRATRAVNRLHRPETTVVASVAFCFAVALLTQWFGYSVALGAFVAGSLVAESGEADRIEHLITPVRDIFAAVFFVSVGMLIDPPLIAEHWLAIVVLTGVVIAGKVTSVSVGAFLTGNTTRTAVQAGMSLAQIGEFSFIIAALGMSLGATRDFLYPVAVAVSALTTMTTPWFIRASGPVATVIEGRLPRPVQTFTALYGSWLDQLRVSRRASSSLGRARQLFGLMLLDAFLLTAVVLGPLMMLDDITTFLEAQVGLGESTAGSVVFVACAILAIPFSVGILRISQSLGLALAEAALPRKPADRPDAVAAPRKALVRIVQIASVLVIGTPLVAVTQPFLSTGQGAVVLLAFLVLLGVAFWRSANTLQGHVLAGAQVLAEALASQSMGSTDDRHRSALRGVHHLVPGLGAAVPVTVHAASAVVGRTLGEINLRGDTGATVLAIHRGDQDVLVPSAKEVLLAGDVLALAGPQEALIAARRLLGPGGVHAELVSALKEA